MITHSKLIKLLNSFEQKFKVSDVPLKRKKKMKRIFQRTKIFSKIFPLMKKKKKTKINKSEKVLDQLLLPSMRLLLVI